VTPETAYETGAREAEAFCRCALPLTRKDHETLDLVTHIEVLVSAESGTYENPYVLRGAASFFAEVARELAARAAALEAIR
jgi:hypothetical protein